MNVLACRERDIHWSPPLEVCHTQLPLSDILPIIEDLKFPEGKCVLNSPCHCFMDLRGVSGLHSKYLVKVENEVPAKMLIDCWQ